MRRVRLKDPDLVIAIDPSSGANSAVGVAIIDPGQRVLVDFLEIICPKYTPVEQRIKLINSELKKFLYPKYVTGDILVCVEFTVMQGKSGQSLNRAIGAIIAATPVDSTSTNYRDVHNGAVKKLHAGHGAADKASVAMGLLNFFQGNQNTTSAIKDLTSLKKWDILDAIAIGVTGYMQYISGEDTVGHSEKAKEKRKGKRAKQNKEAAPS